MIRPSLLLLFLILLSQPASLWACEKMQTLSCLPCRPKLVMFTSLDCFEDCCLIGGPELNMQSRLPRIYEVSTNVFRSIIPSPPPSRNDDDVIAALCCAVGTTSSQDGGCLNEFCLSTWNESNEFVFFTPSVLYLQRDGESESISDFTVLIGLFDCMAVLILGTVLTLLGVLVYKTRKCRGVQSTSQLPMVGFMPTNTFAHRVSAQCESSPRRPTSTARSLLAALWPAHRTSTVCPTPHPPAPACVTLPVPTPVLPTNDPNHSQE